MRWLATIAALLAILVLASACNRGPQRLDVLRTDPLATVDLPDAVAVSLSESAGNTGGGVVAPSVIRHTFTVQPGTATQVIEELLMIARGAGWTMAESSIGYDGDKTIDGLYSQVVISGIESQDVVWIEIYSTD